MTTFDEIMQQIKKTIDDANAKEKEAYQEGFADGREYEKKIHPGDFVSMPKYNQIGLVTKVYPDGSFCIMLSNGDHTGGKDTTTVKTGHHIDLMPLFNYIRNAEYNNFEIEIKPTEKAENEEV